MVVDGRIGGWGLFFPASDLPNPWSQGIIKVQFL